MKNRDFSFLLIPFAALLAAYLPFSSGGQQTPNRNPPIVTEKGAAAEGTATTEKQAPAVPLASKDNNAVQLLYQFLYANPEACQAGTGDVPSNVREMKSQYVLEFLIATMPDPRESRLDYLFDRNLDAVQRAIESVGYVLDRYDFPKHWRNEANGNGDRGGKEDSTADQPGLILFRSRTLDTPRYCPRENDESRQARNPSGRLLVLFIVGETPTAGINKTALKNALDQITLLSLWNEGAPEEYACLPRPARDGCKSPIPDVCWPNTGAPPDREIRIMGPTFSGSEDSLELALQSWLEENKGAFLSRDDNPTMPPVFSVLSGSATSISQCKFCNRIKTHGQPVFHSTVPSSQVSIEAFKEDLVRNDPLAARNKIAIFKETNTVYGQSSMFSSAGRKQEQTAASGMMIDGQWISSESPACPDQKPRATIRTIDIPFPLHISQLRTASEKAKSSRATPALDLRSIRRPILPLLMDDERTTQDVIPLFSQLEPASLELVLSNLLNEMNREQIRYIGIVSTDVKDCIFLVSEIRKHCPNAIVFLFFADVLYLRPEVNLDLQGALVVTPYSLYGPNQFWSYPISGQQTRFQFSTHVSQGAYNATLALMGKSELIEYGKPFDNVFVNPMQGRLPDETPRKPALWVSVVGRQGFMPVKTLEYEKLLGDGPAVLDRYPLPIPRTATPPPAPILHLAGGINSKMTTAVLVLLIMLGLLPVAMLVLLIARTFHLPIDRIGPLQRLQNSWLGEMISDAVIPDYFLRRRVYLLACCAGLLVIYLSLMWVFLLPLHVLWDSARDVSAFDTLAYFLWPGATWKSERLLPDAGNSLLVARLAVGTVMAFSTLATLWLCGSVTELFYSRTRKTELKDAPAKTSAKPRFYPSAVAAFFLGLATIVAIGTFLMQSRPSPLHVYFFVRATDLTSGVSPLLPLLLIGLAAFLCAFCALRRWSLVERAHLTKHWELKLEPNEFPNTQSFLNFEGAGNNAQCSLSGVNRMETRVMKLLEMPSYRLPASFLVLAIVLGAMLYVFFYRYIPSMEGMWYDRAFRLAFFIVSLGLGLDFLRFVSIWMALRKLLRRLASHPLFMRQIGEKTVFNELPQISLTSPAPNYTPLSLSVTQAVKLCRMMGSAAKQEGLSEQVVLAEQNLQKLLEFKARDQWQEVQKMRCEVQARLADIAGKVALLLEPGWSLSSPGSAFKAADPAWIAQAELFLAGRVYSFLQYLLAHLQNLVVFVTTGMLLVLLSITSYPFQPRDLMLLFGWLLILLVVAATLVVFTQMDRDKVLSLLSGGDPGKLNWNREYIWRVLIHGVVPILALLSAQFPEALQQIATWVSALQGGGR